MSGRNIHALIYGHTGSGVTTLIMRWVSGRLPTSVEELTAPYNGVKNINIQLAEQKTSEVVMVTLIDGGVFLGDEEGLRRVCRKVDVIVACTCVQVDDLGLPEIRRLSMLLGLRRPPIIVLGTMRDLRDEAIDQLPLLTAIACSDDVEELGDVIEETEEVGRRNALSSGYPELAVEPRRLGNNNDGKKPGLVETPSVTSEHSIEADVFEEQSPLLLVSKCQDQSVERNRMEEKPVNGGETQSLMPGQFQVTVKIENAELQKGCIYGSESLDLGVVVPKTKEKVHFSESESHPIVPESDVIEETGDIVNGSSLSRKLELTIQNVKRHSIKNEEPETEICSFEDDCSAAQETPLMSDGEASDVTGSDRRMASPTDLEFDNIEHDLSFLSRELMNISSHRMNPDYWSTESINGSVASPLDHSRDVISVVEPAHGRPFRENGDAAEPSPHQDHANTNDNGVIGQELNHSSDTNTSPLKPMLETHFPADNDSSFTVKYFPCTQNSKTEISNQPIETHFPERVTAAACMYRSTECSQAALDKNNVANSWIQCTGRSCSCDECIASKTQEISSPAALPHGEVSTSSSSSFPEVKNLHISLDLAPVKLIDPYPGKARLRGANSDSFMSIEDGTRCVKNVRGERYMECSALTGENLHQVFEYVVRAGCKYNRRRNAKCLIS
ncbi:uncharacterized protein LOC124134614 [Haliotis rufescens]|uniref:uncharacterized protein LOC124134614 n=1 Tax=Haliotis rufescens TaxID=6454 RepID=UPI00201EA0C2|nr:uncharacterized protein LOC124134614 [Haliotis rufescens]